MPDLSDIIANYFERGYRFRRIEAGNAIHTQSPKAVFLIHGWGVRAVSMDDLAHALADLDFSVFNYDYPTAERNIEEHSQIFLDLYRRTLRREHITWKVYFLTHSMGGILLRSAMAKMSEAECRKIEAIVMLGPAFGMGMTNHNHSGFYRYARLESAKYLKFLIIFPEFF